MRLEQPIIEEPAQTPEELAEDEIRAADDAVEIRIIPLGGDIGKFAYVTERILRSESIGKQVRKIRKLVPIDDAGERGYQKRGETTTVEPIAKGIERRNMHMPDILPEDER